MLFTVVRKQESPEQRFSGAEFNMKNNRIQRIEAMERLLDQVLAADSLNQVEEHLNILHNYYFGLLWREDYAADEAGLLPADLKRGVLSQDTLYNLLTEWLVDLKQKATDDLRYIYGHLKDKYPLTFTNTFSLDAGFTEDIPIICGSAGGKSFWLYWDDSDFVFSHETPDQEYHDHCHSQDISEAIEFIEIFIAQTVSDNRYN